MSTKLQKKIAKTVKSLSPVDHSWRIYTEKTMIEQINVTYTGSTFYAPPYRVYVAVDRLSAGVVDQAEDSSPTSW